MHQFPVRRGNRGSLELLVLRCLSSTCTRCKSVKRLPEKVLGPINLFDCKRIGLLIIFLCCHHPFLCSPPWFWDSLARFWYFVADHIDEFVMKPAQRAEVRENVDFLRKNQLLGLFVPVEVDEIEGMGVV